MAAFRKTRVGRMGILTIPVGTCLYRRHTKGKTFERASKEFDVLAMPTTATAAQAFARAFSFKMRQEFWYVLAEDVLTDEDEGDDNHAA